jgi:hypothetical protein
MMEFKTGPKLALFMPLSSILRENSLPAGDLKTPFAWQKIDFVVDP